MLTYSGVQAFFFYEYWKKNPDVEASGKECWAEEDEVDLVYVGS